MTKRLLTALAAVAILASSCCGDCAQKGTSYYVATTGDDSNDGSQERPFRSISKAAAIMEAGDECVIRGGVYREIVTPLNSGEEGRPITFRNFEGERVVVDATEPLNGWTKYKGDIYKAKVHHRWIALKPEWQALFYSDRLVNEARFPNDSDNDLFTFEGVYVDGGSASHVFSKSNKFPDVDLTGAAITYFGQHCGATWTRPITKSSSAEIHFEAVDLTDWPFSNHNPTLHRGDNKGQIFVYGALELLDHPNEWYYDGDKGIVYAIFPDRKKPADDVVKIASRIRTMDIRTDYIVVDGLELFGGEVRFQGSHGVIRNCNLQNCSQIRDRFDDCEAQMTTGALVFEGNYLTAERNLIEHGSNNGIVMLGGIRGAHHYVIDNNIVRYFNTLGIHANPILSDCDNTIITRNTVSMCGRDGVTTGNTWGGRNCEVAYNDVSHCMLINNDGGIYYTVGNDEYKHTKIHHNWFHDSFGPAYADGRAAGIYLDNYSKGYDVYNNVISNVTWTGFQYNLYNTDFNFYNNTIVGAGASIGRWVAGFRMERVNISNNFADKSASVVKTDNSSKSSVKDEWIGTNITEHNLIGSADMFEDAANGNFMPKEGSPLIDAGEQITNFEIDYSGGGVDLGAYERGKPAWKAGATWIN
ncbi:MAG: right-handed parallel beta-helix repeat-containing protein [Rikenellaceae bacterium]